VTSDVIGAETTGATNEVNIPKNRYQDKIPCKVEECAGSHDVYVSLHLQITTAVYS
jgi:hypothetical protein